jgi:antitoxin Phd
MADSYSWQLQDAKARFSELVQKALDEGPQTITRRGKDSVVLVSGDEYRRLKRKGTDLVSFLRSAPPVELDIDRSADAGRNFDL